MQQHPTHFTLFDLLAILLLLLLLLLTPLAHATHHLSRRQSPNNTIISINSIPTCARNPCSNYWTPSNLDCPSTSSEGITHECLCSTSLAPLTCAPYHPSSPSECFFETVNWHNNLCSPQHVPKTISLDQLPACARQCTNYAISHLGCDNTLNCVCQLEYLPSNTAFCIDAHCDDDTKTYIGNLQSFTQRWLTQSCRGPSRVPKELFISPTGTAVPELPGLFEGEEWLVWKKALEDKRDSSKSLGAIIPLSLIFGGIGIVIGWRIVWSIWGGVRTRRTRSQWTQRAARANARAARGPGLAERVRVKMVGWIEGGAGAIGRGLTAVWQGGKPVVKKVWGKIVHW